MKAREPLEVTGQRQIYSQPPYVQHKMHSGAAIDDDSRESLNEVVQAFPSVDLAFAYGSGAVRQGSYDYSRENKDRGKELPMLDLIFAVENSEAWHTANKERHRDHYTSMIDLKPSQIAFVQRKIGARVWFNAMVPTPNMTGTIDNGKRLLKYGVIETSDFTERFVGVGK